jgi:hypothetical protein
MHKFLADIQTYCDAVGISTGTFGSYALNDGKFFARIASGKRCWPETEERARAYMAANPPRSVADTPADGAA